MNIKTFKTKPIAALALTLLMVMPLLFAAVSVVRADNTPVISVVLSGTTSTTTIPQVAVGSTFNVDVRIDNTQAITEGISGDSYNLTWDPTVLECTNYVDPGPYLTTGASQGHVLSVTSAPDNVNGVFTVGDDIDNQANASASSYGSGVLSTLTFQVLKFGQSDLNLEPSDVGVTYLATTLNPNLNANAVDAIYNPLTTSINLFGHGTTSSTIQVPSGTNQIGSDIMVDAYISNPLAYPVWGWNIGVTWNPAVLQLELVNEGTYLNPAPSSQGYSDPNSSTTATIFLVGKIDNTLGMIDSGISDIYENNVTTNAATGVLCTLTFEVINYANSTINITAGTPTLINNNLASISDQLNNATFVSQPIPPPRAPVANYTLITGTLTPTSGENITLSALNSLPGFDAIPNPMTPNFAITQYTWTLVSSTAPTGITFPASGSQISFFAPNPSTQAFSINLTVATATNPADSNYKNVSQPITITFSPSFPGAQLDVYILNIPPISTTNPYKSPTGQGTYNDTVDTFAPQQLMNLEAYATWNFAPVSDKLVTFYVNGMVNGVETNIGTFVVYTNDNGYADVSYRLPNYNSTVMPFGNYTVTATVDLAGSYESDSFTFQYCYIVNIISASMASQVNRGQYAALTVTLNNTSLQPQTYSITYTVTDNAGVAVFSGEVASQTIAAATLTTLNGHVTTETVMLYIPTYAFPGPSLVHINVFNADPSNPANHALPYCPEFDEPFLLTAT